MTNHEQFNPDWISPPGDTIDELLEELGWRQTDLAKRMDVTAPFVNDLVKGRVPISTQIAERLSRVLGSTPNFWLVRDAQYQAGLARKDAIEAARKDAGWLKELPLPWMRKLGLIRNIREKGEQVLDSLRFFCVASVDAWREQYQTPVAAFRASDKFQKNVGAVAAWLREGERRANNIPCEPFNKQAFRDALRELRALTNESDPDVFIVRMTEVCAACGVAVVFLETPPGCPASGATRWLAPAKAMLLLSLRYNSNDHVWFTFFHEAAHLLLHGKKLLFIEGLGGLDNESERQADVYASNILIKPADANRLHGLAARQFRSKDDVRSFATGIGIAPGIVVGRMQKEGWLDWSFMNNLKVYYEWSSAKSVT
ncbi:MAG: HigA family addiction module antitoxin [Candidatus Lernaella stagnicola]|nr:HigA family addiction module antitoxin [Candidatus Lernaella stagnicola]